MPQTTQFIRRWAQKDLDKAMASHRVVSVVGCRQSGKTTMLENANLPNSQFFSLDSTETLQSIQNDINYFLRARQGQTLILDEVQKEPALIGEIKYIVDRNPDRGQFVLSGSADYRKIPGATESLAGRSTFVRVRTLSEAEKRGGNPLFLESLFAGKLPKKMTFDACYKDEVARWAIAGGFPELASNNDIESRARWYRAYVDNQVILDMRNQWGFRKSDLLKNLLTHASVFSSKLLSTKSICELHKASWETINNYLSALEAMYLIEKLPGWATNDYDTPGTTPKLFMTDSGLMAHLMAVFSESQLLNADQASGDKLGKLVETWIYNQLKSEIELHPLWSISHMRTKSHEIDFLVFDEQQRFIAIEVKASETVRTEDFKHLHWLRSLVGPEKFVKGIVLYAGQKVFAAGNDCYGLPMSAFWDDFSEWF
ncbi:MAG: AAA family ATPase [Sutterellaceae bacterium]|nr:AAA family ATPase [Sutterellaceae bacterium]